MKNRHNKQCAFCTTYVAKDRNLCKTHVKQYLDKTLLKNVVNLSEKEKQDRINQLDKTELENSIAWYKKGGE